MLRFRGLSGGFRAVKKELGDHKQAIVREYLKCSISRKELVTVLGEKEVDQIDHIAKIGRKSFQDAAKMD